MTKWQDANGEYARQQAQQWQKPLTANRNATAGRLGRIEQQDALIADPRNGIGAVRVGDSTPEGRYREIKGGRKDSRSDGRWSATEFKAMLDRVKAEHDARKAGKPHSDRSDSYRQDDFSLQDADCWQQGQWVCAYSDGKLLKWKRKDAPQEVLQRLQA
ncbi:hypothetical protein VZG28_14530 (plasmid) [Synechococcus elongatus IITB4]|uniref:hypothetical protein n=1 Tax=Synechococcus elongatus TaxID=32046 RepID=UPI0030D2D323